MFRLPAGAVASVIEVVARVIVVAASVVEVAASVVVAQRIIKAMGATIFH